MLWIWRYDKFSCLAFWRRGWSNKLFLRVMLVGYITSFPAHIAQCFWLAYIKYKVGFLPMNLTGASAEYNGFPVPYYFWPEKHKNMIRPIEVCHQEEVFYWLFLLHLKPTSPGWFRSYGFKATIVSAVAFPVLFTSLQVYFAYYYTSTNVATSQVYMTEGVITFAMSTVIILQNATFSFWINPRFPQFLRQLEEKGATPDLLRRFATFDMLNRLRVVARWLFGVPLFILAVDSLFGSNKLNMIPWLVDVFIFVSYPGLLCGSILTLVIFLPVRGRFDHLAFNSNTPSYTSTSSSVGPYFDQPPPAGTRLSAFRPTGAPRSPTLPINNILRLPLPAVTAQDGQELHRNGSELDLDSKTPSGAQAQADLEIAAGVSKATSSSGHRLSHPFTSHVSRRAAAAGQTGYATTDGATLAPLLHPEILGFSSSIDIHAWSCEVQKSTSGLLAQTNEVVEIEMVEGEMRIGRAV
ncbi:hypothetical protein JCM11641_004596 [Rhodosporidiobolus odoratus]